jgi:hypothetical protein
LGGLWGNIYIVFFEKAVFTDNHGKHETLGDNKKQDAPVNRFKVRFLHRHYLDIVAE